jgi:3-hydroxybutyrate dehydrogenase
MAALRPLAGKLALVTGSSSGIGLGIAKVLAAQGANLIVHGVAPAAELEALAAKLAKEHSVKCHSSDADLLGGEAAIARMCAAADGAPVDILVNNAGIQVRAGLLAAIEREATQPLQCST